MQDTEIITDVLFMLYEYDGKNKDSALDVSNASVNASKEGPIKPAAGYGGSTKKRLAKQHIDLYELDENKETGDAENVLEFLLITLGRNLQLKPKQAAGLLANNNKYLVHVACKGVKGDHEKVVAWYQDVYAKCR